MTTDALAETASVSIDGLPDALGRDRSTLAPVFEEKYRWTKGMLRAGVTAILLTVCGGCHTPTYLADLWGKFEALPFDQSATIQMCAGSLHHSFARWEAEPRRAAAACSTSHQYDDLSGLPEGFVPLAETLRSLQ